MKIKYIAVAAVAAIAGWMIGTSAWHKPAAAGRQPGLLFVQSVTGGGFDGEVLSVKEEAPLILYFSDRPDRFIGQMTAARFLRLWGEGKDDFKADPPNAVLSILKDKEVNNVTMELLNPVVEGGTWKYRVKVLAGTLPKKFGAASLFIDAFPAASANAKVLGDAPAVAMGNLYQSTSQALADAAHNATGQSGATTVYPAKH